MSSVAGVYSVAYVTVPNDTVAKKIARYRLIFTNVFASLLDKTFNVVYSSFFSQSGLVENKLAACVNIIPQLTSM